MTAKAGGQTALIVDDDETSLFIMETIFRSVGLPTITARDGMEAVEAAASSRVDIVFMDLNMPHMDGVEAARRILAGPAAGARPLPVIAVSANATLAARNACFDAGIVDFVQKPVVIEQILEIARRHLGRLPSDGGAPGSGNCGEAVSG